MIKHTSRGLRSYLPVLLAGVFVIGVADRLAAVAYLNVPARYAYDDSGFLTFDGRRGDDREYEGRGWSLVSGGDFWVLPSGDGNAPPGFPFLIGVVYAVTGREVTALLILNALIGGATAIATFFLARAFMKETLAIGAALLVALDPLLVFSSTRILAETLTVFLGVLVLAVASRTVDDRTSMLRAIALGIVMATAILVRNQLLAVVGATVLWLTAQIYFGSRRLWPATVSVLTCAAVFLAVTFVSIQNRPASSSDQFQQMLRGSQLASAGYIDVSLDRAVRVKGSALTFEEREEVVRKATEFVRLSPTWQVVLANWVERFRIFWQLVPSVGSSSEKVIYGLSTTLLFGLSFLGVLLWLSRQTTEPRQAREVALLLVLTCLAMTVLHVVVHAKPRYRLPLHPILAMWAMYAFGDLATRVSRLTRHVWSRDPARFVATPNRVDA